MHPKLFSIPLVNGHLPVAILLLVFAGLAVILGIRGFLVERKTAKPDYSGVATSAIAAAVLVGGRFYLRFARPEWQSIELGSIPIYSYGVMLGLSLVVGWYLTLGLAERDGLPKEMMANCYVITAIVAVIGSRVLYILTNLDEFQHVEDLFAFRNGGLVAYGGFLGGFVGSWCFLKYTVTRGDGAKYPSLGFRKYPISILPWADVAVPSLASGLLITRIGCYLFGCDFGRPLSEGAPGWLKRLGTFPHWAEGTMNQSGSPAWAQHVKQHLIADNADFSLPVHPTELYESLVGLALLVFVLTIRRYQRFRGQVFLAFTAGYGLLRFLLEILRDDNERGSLPPSLPRHILLPLGLAIFGLAWTVGFSCVIKNDTIRKLTSGAAFLPAIALFFALRPESFALAPEEKFSTSQFVALTTSLAASIGFSVLWRAAVAHPEAAMALNLPPAEGEVSLPAPAREPVAAEDEDEDEDEEEEEEDKPVRKARRAKKAKAKKAADAGPRDAGKTDSE